MLKMKKNKKAVSALIATVMLILVTMAAVVLVWQMVIPLIRTSIEKSNACRDAMVMVNTEAGFTYYKNDTREISVMVGRGEADVKVIGIQIKVLSSGGVSKVFTRTSKKNDTIPGPSEEFTYKISATEHNLTTTEKPVSVAVGAIVAIGKEEYKCPLTPEASLKEL